MYRKRKSHRWWHGNLHSLLSSISHGSQWHTLCGRVSAYPESSRLVLKGKATFEAHFHVLPKASYNWLWYPFAMNYNYLNPVLFNYYTHFTLRRFCDAKFLLKQTVQNKQFGSVSLELSFLYNSSITLLFKRCYYWLIVVVMHDWAHIVCALH